VLPEEEYLQHLDAIIERDFFPDLPKLRLQLAWLTAVERGDTATMAAIRATAATSVRRTDAVYAAPTPAPPAPGAPSASAVPPALLAAARGAFADGGGGGGGGGGGSIGVRRVGRSTDLSRALRALDLAGTRAGVTRGDTTPLRGGGARGGSDDSGSGSESGGGGGDAAWRAVEQAAGRGGKRFRAGAAGDGGGVVDEAAAYTVGGATTTAGAAASAAAAAAAAVAAAEAAAANPGTTLTTFQRRFTTEDNASFAANHEADLTRKQRQHWWLYEHVSTSKLRYMLTDGNASRAVRAGELRNDNARGVALLEDGALGGDTHGLVRSWRHRPMNALFWEPVLAVSNSISGVAAGGAGSGARLALMDAGADWTRSGAASAVVSLRGMDIILPTGHRVSSATGGVIAPPQLRAAATRLSDATQRAAAAADTDDAPLAAPGAASSPRINGYAFLASPGALPPPVLPPPLPPAPPLPPGAPPFPFVVTSGAGATDGPSFRIVHDSPREETAARLAASASTNLARRAAAAAAAAGSGGAGGLVGGNTATRRPAFGATPTPFHIPLASRGAASPGAASVVSASTGGGARSVARSAVAAAAARLSPAGLALARTVAAERARAASGTGGSSGSRGGRAVTDFGASPALRRSYA